MTKTWLEQLEAIVEKIRSDVTKRLHVEGDYDEIYEGREPKSRPPEGNVTWAYVDYGVTLPGGRALPLAEAFVAASFLVRMEAEFSTRNFGGKDFGLTLVTQIGEEQIIKLHDALSGNSGSICRVSFPATKPDRTHDGECLIVNAIASRIACGMKVTSIFLQTELPPCASCRSVIGAFMQKHSHIRMEVRYEMLANQPEKQAIQTLAATINGKRLTFTSLAEVEAEHRSG